MAMPVVIVAWKAMLACCREIRVRFASGQLEVCITLRGHCERNRKLEGSDPRIAARYWRTR
jgi:hypothetical protein